MKRTNPTLLLKGIFLCLLTISISNCKKTETTTVEDEAQPLADFTTDKAQYTTGETIHLTSTSTNANRFTWTFPDGQTGKSSAADYLLTEDHSVLVKLEAFSPKSTKSDYVVKTIKVKPAEGQVVLYTYSSGYGGNNVDLYLDNNFFAQVTLSTNLIQPNCGQAGFPTVNIPVGQHLLTVKIGGTLVIYSGSITVVKNDCVKVQV